MQSFPLLVLFHYKQRTYFCKKWKLITLSHITVYCVSSTLSTCRYLKYDFEISGANKQNCRIKGEENQRIIHVGRVIASYFLEDAAGEAVIRYREDDK